MPIVPGEQNSSEPTWCSENKEMGFHFQVVMVATDLFLVQVRSRLSVLPCDLKRCDYSLARLGRLVLRTLLP